MTAFPRHVRNWPMFIYRTFDHCKFEYLVIFNINDFLRSMIKVITSFVKIITSFCLSTFLLGLINCMRLVIHLISKKILIHLISNNKQHLPWQWSPSPLYPGKQVH